MRPRGSITGPLIIIGLGVLFLVHAVSPDFPLLDWLGLYWPYVLIGWGVVALLEVTFRTLRGGPIPTNGVSGGGWFLVVLICLVGLSAYQMRKPDTWWRNTDWSRGFDDAFGEQHDYSVNVTQKKTGPAPHIVIEDFRGDAKINGAASNEVTVGGHKTIRASKDALSDRADAATPVEVELDGNNLIVRCNQNRAPYRTSVTTNLELTVPRGASIEISGTRGDFDISGVNGDLALRSGNAGVRVDDIGGAVTVDTRTSDLVRCTNVKGAVNLRGHGSDIELDKIIGPVTINGEYTGTISLRELSQSVRLQNMRTDLQVASIPGEIRLDRGSLNIQDAVGPLHVDAHSTDISLENISNGLEISVDRGDVDLKPGKLPLGKMMVHASAGNIELALPVAAAFSLNATTDSGEIDNQFGDALKLEASGRGAHLTGTAGTGPSIDLVTGRGSIVVRKGEAGQQTVASLAQ
ncbi:MAG TPA: DUF4097 family beta strand repeat-containing protein [Bryobacteraceae bacterium]|nr:DUF4097 family beta strand repeat-containing protein [Bryobacteraceae bacterium]